MSKVAITGNASGTGVFTVASPNSNVDRVLTLPDESGTVLTTTTILTPSATNTSITLGTAVATTSGTSIDFTGIPAGVKRVTVMFNGVSTNGANDYLVQLGISTGVVATGYLSTTGRNSNGVAVATTSSTAGFVTASGDASFTASGHMMLTLVGGNIWISSHSGKVNNVQLVNGGGSLSLGGVLDRIRLTMIGGTDSFDAGSVNISWEF